VVTAAFFRPALGVCVIVLLLGLLSGIRSAAAQESGTASPPPESAKLEEVIVTAQRREQNLSDVPMTVQTFAQQDLDQQGLRTIDDLTRVAPAVTFLRSGSNANSNFNDENSDISIRGVDSQSGPATTAIYLDDAPIQARIIALNNPSPYPALFDLERVEVLKGPQGTLFGTGAEGGAIRFITPAASVTDYSGYVRAEFGQIEDGGQNYEIGAAFGGPIIDGVLGFRVSASFREDGGWVDRVDYVRPPSYLAPCTGCSSPATVYTAAPTASNITEPNANWHDTDTFHGQLRWQPADNLTIDPSIYVQTLHINDTGAYWINLSDPANGVYNNGNAQRDSSTDPWTLSALRIAWHLPWADVFSATSYLARDQHSSSDYSQWVDTVFFSNQYPPPGDTSTAPFTDHQRTFSQEIRLSSPEARGGVQWTAGVYYGHSYENVTAQIYSQDLSPATPNYIAFDSPVDSVLDEQLAAFGELSYDFLRVFTVTAGLRYSKLNYTTSSVMTGYGALGDGMTTSVSASGSSRPVTPRFVLDYKPDADSLYYASAAKGFRTGSTNPPIPSGEVTACGGQVPENVAPDWVWQYEIGAKNTLLERRLQLNVSVYYLQWSNIQQSLYLPCGVNFSANLGEAVGKGGELSLTWIATNDLTIGFTGAYTDTAYTEVVTLPGFGGSYTAVRPGDHLPASPWNLDANAEYVWNAFAKHPYIRADYQFATAQHSLTAYQDPANAPLADPTIPGLPEIRMLSVRGGLRFNGFDVSIFAQNALNYHTPIYVSRDFATSPVNGIQPDLDTNYYGRGYPPRTIGLTTTYRF
jgi:iron complex outermembrane recepter protein